MNKIYKALFGGAILFGATAFSPAAPATAADGWYVSGSGGVSTLRDSNSKGTITGGSATGDVSFDSGFGFSGAIGHASGPIRLGANFPTAKMIWTTLL